MNTRNGKLERRGSFLLWAGLVLVFAGAVLFNGCPSGGVDSSNNQPSNGEIVSDEQRLSTLDSALETFAQISGQGGSADSVNAAMLEYLTSQPGIEEAGVDEASGVWARFVDGRLLIVVNNRAPQPIGQSKEALSVAQRAVLAKTTELPVRTQARIFQAFGPEWEAQEPVADIAGWLQENEYQLVPAAPGDADVATLRGVSGDGVFYFNSHSGWGTRKDGLKLFSIWTSTPVTAKNEKDQNIKNDLNKFLLAYMLAQSDVNTLGDAVYSKHYAITSGFVRRYMSFSENSLVFINSCSSANRAMAGVNDMISAFHENGASLYVGWSGTIGSKSFTSARYFFDRLLGANRFEPEDPKQRPFEYTAVLADMNRLGYDKDGASSLVAAPNPKRTDHFALLAPTIKYLNVNEEFKQLFIHGIFGLKQGKVKVGGTEVNVEKWEKEKITCSLAGTGQNSAGDVVVEVDGRKSNVVRLTEWKGQIRYTHKSFGDLLWEMTFDIHFRADIHAYRDEPHKDPIEPVVAFIASPVSTGSYEASGSYSNSEGTTTWSGSGILPSLLSTETGGAAQVYFCFGVVDPKLKTVRLFLSGSAEHTVTLTPPGESFQTGMTIFPQVFDGMAQPQLPRLDTLQWPLIDILKLAPMFYVDLTMDNDFNINSGLRMAPIGEEGEAKIVWDVMPRQHPPDQDAAR